MSTKVTNCLLLFLSLLLVGCFDNESDEKPITNGEKLNSTTITSHNETAIGKRDSLIINFDVIKDSIYTVKVYNSSETKRANYNIKIKDENDSTIHYHPSNGIEISAIRAKETARYTLYITLNYIDDTVSNVTPTVEIYKIGTISNRFDGQWYIGSADCNLGPYSAHYVCPSPKESFYFIKINGDSITQYYKVYGGAIYPDSSKKLLAEHWLFNEPYMNYTFEDSVLTFNYSINGEDVTSTGFYQFLKESFDAKKVVANNSEKTPNELQGTWYKSKYFEASLKETNNGNYNLKEYANTTIDEEDKDEIWEISSEYFLKHDYYDNCLSKTIQSKSHPWKNSFFSDKGCFIKAEDETVTIGYVGHNNVELHEFTRYTGNVPPVEWKTDTIDVPIDEAIEIQLDTEIESKNIKEWNWYTLTSTKKKSYNITIFNGDSNLQAKVYNTNGETIANYEAPTYPATFSISLDQDETCFLAMKYPYKNQAFRFKITESE